MVLESVSPGSSSISGGWGPLLVFVVEDIGQHDKHDGGGHLSATAHYFGNWSEPDQSQRELIREPAWMNWIRQLGKPSIQGFYSQTIFTHTSLSVNPTAHSSSTGRRPIRSASTP